MNENQFNAMLAIIVPPIIEQITTRQFQDFISPDFIRNFLTKIQSFGITAL
jgi:hypothetical protein